MGHYKAITFIAAAILGTTLSLGLTSSANAQQARPNWFYDRYEDYDYRTFRPKRNPRYNPQYYRDSDEYDPLDEANRSRYLTKRQKRARALSRQRRARKARLRAWAREQRQRDRDYYGDEAPSPGYTDQPSPRDITPTPRLRRPIRKQKVVAVPVPRKKPEHMIPPSMRAKKVTPPAATPSNPAIVFDQRPSLEAAPAPQKKITLAPKPTKKLADTGKKKVKKKIKGKKGIDIAALPDFQPEQLPVKPKAKTKPTVPPVATKPEKKKPVAKVKPRKKIAIVIEGGKKPPKAKTPPKTPKGQISCKKAKSIVTDFGFSNIEMVDCSSKIYAFDASRDGKPYSVKLSGLNGELKNIKRRN